MQLQNQNIGSESDRNSWVRDSLNPKSGAKDATMGIMGKHELISQNVYNLENLVSRV